MEHALTAGTGPQQHVAERSKQALRRSDTTVPEAPACKPWPRQASDNHSSETQCAPGMAANFNFFCLLVLLLPAEMIKPKPQGSGPAARCRAGIGSGGRWRRRQAGSDGRIWNCCCDLDRLPRDVWAGFASAARAQRRALGCCRQQGGAAVAAMLPEV